MIQTMSLNIRSGREGGFEGRSAINTTRKFRDKSPTGDKVDQGGPHALQRRLHGMGNRGGKQALGRDLHGLERGVSMKIGRRNKF